MAAAVKAWCAEYKPTMHCTVSVRIWNPIAWFCSIVVSRRAAVVSGHRNALSARLTRQCDATPLANQCRCSFHASARDGQLDHHTPVDGGQLPANCQVVAPRLQLDFSRSAIERLQDDMRPRTGVHSP